MLLSCGFACSFIGLLASIVLEGLELGALTNATAAATYSGFMHFLRLFGGQVGASFMGHLISAREKFHSNLLGLHVQLGNWLTDERLRMLAAGLLPGSSGPDEAQNRAAGILSRQVQAQAYTLAVSDGFVVIADMMVDRKRTGYPPSFLAAYRRVLAGRAGGEAAGPAEDPADRQAKRDRVGVAQRRDLLAAGVVEERQRGNR